MRTRTSIAAAALCGLLVLSGCASTGALDDTQKLAIYRAATGEPVNSFSYLGSINGWTPIGDSHIAVWTRPSQAYLLSFHGPCQDIDFTPVISLTSQGSRVYAGFDKVMVHNRSSIQLPCRIREIRPLDTTKVKAAEKAAREDAQEASSGT